MSQKKSESPQPHLPLTELFEAIRQLEKQSDTVQILPEKSRNFAANEVSQIQLNSCQRKHHNETA